MEQLSVMYSAYAHITMCLADYFIAIFACNCKNVEVIWISELLDIGSHL